MIQTIKVAKQIVKQNEVKQISDSLFLIRGHQVSIIKKKGRMTIQCDCKNGIDYCKEGVCFHKVSLVAYLLDGDFHKRINQFISDFEIYKKENKSVSTSCLLGVLRELRGLK